MKKILSLFVLSVIMLVPMLASAAVVRVDKELGWGTYGPSFASSATTVNFSTRTVGGDDDTTGVFSLQDAAIFGAGFPVNGGALFSRNDSLLVAYVVIYRDSTTAGAYTKNLTAITAAVQASYNGDYWASAGSSSQAPSSGDVVVTIPLYMVPTLGPSLNLMAPRLRIVFNGSTGSLTGCRAKIIYAAEDARR